MSRIYRGDWPRPPKDRPPFYNEGSFPPGVPVVSRSGTIRGITLGGRAPCPSKTCDGYLICVDWETGQVTFPCTKGWRWAHDDSHIAIVAGGEITGRVINPVDPLAREAWPERSLVLDGVRWPAA